MPKQRFKLATAADDVQNEHVVLRAHALALFPQREGFKHRVFFPAEPFALDSLTDKRLLVRVSCTSIASDYGKQGSHTSDSYATSLQAFFAWRTRGEIKSGAPGSRSQPRQGPSQNADTVRNVLRRGILVRSMADASPAGDEQHGRRRNSRHKQRVVISAADHLRVGHVFGIAGFAQYIHNPLVASRRVIRVQHLDFQLEFSRFTDRAGGFL